MSSVNAWPISLVVDEGDRAYLGIPDRLGDGNLVKAEQNFPSLEEVAGEDWSQEILEALLPRSRAWAWCTRTEVFKETKLSAEQVPPMVDLGSRRSVMVRRGAVRGVTLAFVPPELTREQDVVIYWAGADTEQIPDQILTAPDEVTTWDSEQLLSWCADPRLWTDHKSVADLPVERAVVMFDRQISCGLSKSGAAEIVARLEALATNWGLRVIPGPAEYAWVSKRDLRVR